MISIMICSINPERCNKLLKNISETIGVEYETIIFDNRNERWGICRVYNYCAEKAKFPFLCFIHEDVHIVTEGWGEKIIKTIGKLSNCGVVGFAGGIQARKNISSWWGADEIRANVYDGFNGKNYLYSRLNYTNHRYSNPDAEEISQVLCIDGFFQFVKKTIWKEIKYDENLFSGFHFYDVDFSFAVAERYNNYVLFDFDIFHDSVGHINSQYIKNMFIFQNKWKNKLPKNVGKINGSGYVKYIRSELREAFKVFILCIKEHVGIKTFFGQMLKTNKIGFFCLLMIYIPIKLIIETLQKIFNKI
jgi:hypothetical protein